MLDPAETSSHTIDPTNATTRDAIAASFILAHLGGSIAELPNITPSLRDFYLHLQSLVDTFWDTLPDPVTEDLSNRIEQLHTEFSLNTQITLHHGPPQGATDDQ